MWDYLAIPSLYYDSTDKLFVVPEERTKDYIAFQARLRRRMEDEGKLGSRQTLQREDTTVLFLAFALSFPPFASLLFVPSRAGVGANSAGQRSRGIFTATTRITEYRPHRRGDLESGDVGPDIPLVIRLTRVAFVNRERRLSLTTCPGATTIVAPLVQKATKPWK